MLRVTGLGPCQTPGPGALSGLGARLGLSGSASVLSVCRFRAFVCQSSRARVSVVPVCLYRLHP